MIPHLLQKFPGRQMRSYSISVLMLAAAWTAHGTLAFSNYVAFATGSWPEAVAVADLDGDGKKDVVLTTSSYGTSPNNNSILIFLQNSSGGLSAPAQYSAGGAAVTVAIADFNNDGQKDIAVGRQTAGIRVFWNAHGTFSNYTDYPTANAYQICAGDFNHDGLMDLAGVGWSSSQVDVFLQLTNGGFGSSIPYAASYAGKNDIAAGDVNGDGWTDIVVMNGQSYAVPNLSVLLQTSNGFAPAVPYDLGGNELTTGLGVGDVSGDFRSDVVVVYGGNQPYSKLSVFNQGSNGLLSLGLTYGSYDVPQAIALADLDMDGRLDVVTVHGGWQRAGVYLQTGTGTLATEKLFTLPSASSYNLRGVATGDINSDGRPDIVIADYNHGLVVLYNASPPPPVQISRAWRQPNGAMVLNVPYCGPHGASVVERCETLGLWSPIGTVSDTTWVETDPAPAASARFYRLHIQ